MAEFELALDIGFPAGDVILREANGSKSDAFSSFVGGPEVRDIGVQEDEVVVAEGVLPTKGTAFAHASPDATSQLQSSPQQYFLQPRLGPRVSPWMQKSVLRRPLLRDFPRSRHQETAHPEFIVDCLGNRPSTCCQQQDSHQLVNRLAIEF